MFRELFFRKGFRYDNIYDWDILALPSSERDKLTPDYTTGLDAVERPLGPYDKEMKLPIGDGGSFIVSITFNISQMMSRNLLRKLNPRFPLLQSEL
jgi:hypothetical protein